MNGVAGKQEMLTLPEGEEDNRLDGEELQDWLKRAQKLHGGKVEEKKGIEGQADGEVVNDGDVEVATVDAGEQRKHANVAFIESLLITESQKLVTPLFGKPG